MDKKKKAEFMERMRKNMEPEILKENDRMDAIQNDILLAAGAIEGQVSFAKWSEKEGKTEQALTAYNAAGEIAKDREIFSGATDKDLEIIKRILSGAVRLIDNEQNRRLEKTAGK